MISSSIIYDPISKLFIFLHLGVGVGAGGEEQKLPSISVLYLPWLAFVVAFVFVGILPYSATN